MVDRHVRTRTAHRFFQKCAREGSAFQLDDLLRVTGWKPGAAKSYIGKHWSELLVRNPDKSFTVRQEILRISEEDFIQRAKQKKHVFREHTWESYGQYAKYEFLLPLTREGQLRLALDDLFYVDTLKQRLREIGMDELHRVIQPEIDESEGDYIERLLAFIGGMFSGYSIGHVDGRFRGADLLTREDAAKRLVEGRRYLVDETTAVVRFVVPVPGTVTKHGVGLDPQAHLPAETQHSQQLRVRFLFFRIFVEAIVRTVDEEVVWLLEETPHDRRLYMMRRKD